jgi:hypothetical protein
MNQVIGQAAEVLSNLLPLLVMGVLFWLVLRHPICRLPKRADAERRAEALLRQMLTEEEYQQLVCQGYLKVQSPSVPQRTYLIPRYRGLVRVYESGKSVMRLCVGPVDPVPDADVVLIHKLMIEGNEDEYLRSANVF